MKLINLTPHPIQLFRESSRGNYEDEAEAGKPILSIPPEGRSLRVSENREFDYDLKLCLEEGMEECIPVFEVGYGDCEGLPEPEEGTLLVVSSLVRAALPDRKDLISPDTGYGCVRVNGKIVGTTAFIKN